MQISWAGPDYSWCRYYHLAGLKDSSLLVGETVFIYLLFNFFLLGTMTMVMDAGFAVTPSLGVPMYYVS